MTPEQQALFLAARSAIAEQLGLPGFATADLAAQRAAYKALSAADQVRLVDALAAYVQQNPAGFAASQVATANTRVSDPAYGTGLADTSWSAAAQEFFSASSGNFLDIWKGLNSTLKIVAVIAAIALAGWLLWRFVPAKK